MMTNLIRIGTICLLLLPLEAYSRINPNPKQRSMITEICAYMGPRTFLLSYPQSGNTWLRYCIEVISQRPTIRRHATKTRWLDLHYANPLAWEVGFEIDEHKAPIEKLHEYKESLLCHNNESIYLNRTTDTLIFILRNPKECIARSEYTSLSALLDNLWGNCYKHSIYFENLALFDTWPAERKYLIYYEDLISHPRETLADLLTFLDEPDMRLDQFMHEYDAHKNKCLALYPSTISRGSDPLFHSKKLSPDYRKQVDAWIAEAYPELWHKYLERYRERE